jgi:hypothetical protein
MTLITYADHKFAPAVLICIHLFDGTSHDWCRVENAGGEADDWYCPDCLGRVYELGLDDLRVVCMHCARTLQQGNET